MTLIDQGAVAFLIQRLKSIVHEQLGLSNELSTESADDLQSQSYLMKKSIWKGHHLMFRRLALLDKKVYQFEEE